MTIYPPGAVATILVAGNELTGLATDTGWFYADSAGTGHLSFDEVTHVRPGVLLDLNPGGQNDAGLGHLGSLLLARQRLRPWETDQEAEAYEWLHNLIEQIRSQQPKPWEPTGLGAVVEDKAGTQYVRVWPADAGLAAWRASARPGDFDARRWESIDAIRVLSEGVQPS